MANQSLELTISGDARQLISALQSAGVNVQSFKGQVDNAEDSTNKWKTSAMALGKELLGGLALTTLVSQTAQFAAASEEAGRAQKDARIILTNYLGSAEEYNKVMGVAKEATRGMANETTLAKGSLTLLKSGIAANVEESARLFAAGNALTAAYESQGATFEKYIRLMSSGSVVLFDNFNLTKNQVDAKTQDIMATEGLSKGEAHLVAIKQLLLAEGESLISSISDETVAAAQATAKYEDMQAKLGERLAPAFAAVRNEMADFYDRLSTSIDGVAFASDTMQKLSAETDKAASSHSFFGNIVMSIQSQLEMGLTNVAHTIIENGIGWDALAERYAVHNQQAEETVAALEDEAEGLKLVSDWTELTGDALSKALASQGKYFTELNKMEEDRDKKYTKFQDDMVKTSTTSAEKVTDLEGKKNKELERLFEQYNRERNSLLTRGHGELVANLTKGYEEDKEDLINHYDDMIAEEKSAGEKRRQELINQRNQEQKEYQEHLDDLRLKTILGMLEAGDQLDILTGGVTSKANDAFDLIKNGIIPVTADFQTVIAGYSAKLGNASADYTKIQEDKSFAVSNALKGVTGTVEGQVASFEKIVPASLSAKSAIARDFGDAVVSVDKTDSSVKKATDSLHRMEVQANITAKAISSIPAIPSGKGYQHGGSFTVPGFGSGDRPYLIGLEPGEVVNITPKNYSITQNNYYNSPQAGNPLSYYQLQGMVR